MARGNIDNYPSSSLWWHPVSKGVYKKEDYSVLDPDLQVVHAYRLTTEPSPNEKDEAQRLQVLWPKDFLSEQSWEVAPSWLTDAPGNLPETVRRVMGSSTRFRHKISGRPKDGVLRDQNNPDDAHTLQSLIIDLQALMDEIQKQRNVAQQDFQEWLRRKEEALIPFRKACTAAENSIRSSLRDWTHSVDMISPSSFETAKLRFRDAMSRVDILPAFTQTTLLLQPVLLSSTTPNPQQRVHFPHPRLESF
jgi:hypothetical protein